jgi:hypothetical protein
MAPPLLQNPNALPTSDPNPPTAISRFLGPAPGGPPGTHGSIQRTEQQNGRPFLSHAEIFRAACGDSTAEPAETTPLTSFPRLHHRQHLPCRHLSCRRQPWSFSPSSLLLTHQAQMRPFCSVCSTSFQLSVPRDRDYCVWLLLCTDH